MSVTKATLLEFIRLHRYGVEASHTSRGPPEAALVGFVANERLELFFDCFDSTRKFANLRNNPSIAFVIGGYAPGDERTVQYEGVVDQPTGSELEQFKRDYFAVHPDGLRRSKLAGITHFRVRPHWIRYSDLNAFPAEVVEFAGTELGSDEPPTQRNATAMPYTQLREPWQPRIERDQVFNAFANPRASGELENPWPQERVDTSEPTTSGDQAAPGNSVKR